MEAAEKIKKPIELRKTGMEILVGAMGDDNAQAFVRQCRGTPGWDFGEWLNEQPEKSDEEINAAIEHAQAKARAAGIPDCRVMEPNPL